MFTDQADDLANIMVNFTYPSSDRVAFQINASNWIEAGLIPSRAVLMFGGDKDDLADVYETAEQRLQRRWLSRSDSSGDYVSKATL